MLNLKTKDIKDKKTLLMLDYNAGSYSTIHSNDIGASYVNLGGGINLTSQDGENSFKISKLISEEQVIIFDPEVIITRTPQSKTAILNNPNFKELKAIKNSQVFVIPQGVYLWSVRSGERILQALWIANILYQW